MKMRYITLGLFVTYFGWLARPDFSDRADVSDSCSFPGISEFQFRKFASEVKILFASQKTELNAKIKRTPDSSASYLPQLGKLTLDFIKSSSSTAETIARLHAIGRALDGRMFSQVYTTPSYIYDKNQKPGPRLSAAASDPNWKLGQPKVQQHLFVSFRAQGGQWLFDHPIGRRIESWIIGRRYVDFEYGISTSLPTTTSIDSVLAGQNIKNVFFISHHLPLMRHDISWGDKRIPNHCPDMPAIDTRLKTIAADVGSSISR